MCSYTFLFAIKITRKLNRESGSKNKTKDFCTAGNNSIMKPFFSSHFHTTNPTENIQKEIKTKFPRTQKPALSFHLWTRNRREKGMGKEEGDKPFRSWAHLS
jgi:hypothetical protein